MFAMHKNGLFEIVDVQRAYASSCLEKLQGFLHLPAWEHRELGSAPVKTYRLLRNCYSQL